MMKFLESDHEEEREDQPSSQNQSSLGNPSSASAVGTSNGGSAFEAPFARKRPAPAAAVPSAPAAQAPFDLPGSKRRKVFPRDPHAPKVPATGYQRFCQMVQPTIQADSQSVKITICGHMWSQLSDKEKAPYMKAAEADKAKHALEMEQYMQSAHYQEYIKQRNKWNRENEVQPLERRPRPPHPNQHTIGMHPAHTSIVGVGGEEDEDEDALNKGGLGRVDPRQLGRVDPNRPRLPNGLVANGSGSGMSKPFDRSRGGRPTHQNYQQPLPVHDEPPSGAGTIHCAVCNKNLLSMRLLRKHERTQRHLQKVAELQSGRVTRYTRPGEGDDASLTNSPNAPRANRLREDEEEEEEEDLGRSAANNPDGDIPIFTNRFIDYNKERDGDWKQILRQLASVKEETGALRSEVAKMDHLVTNGAREIEKEETQTAQYKRAREVLLQTLSDLLKEILPSFQPSSVHLQDSITRELENLINARETQIRIPETSQFIQRVEEINWKSLLALPSVTAVDGSLKPVVAGVVSVPL